MATLKPRKQPPVLAKLGYHFRGSLAVATLKPSPLDPWEAGVQYFRGCLSAFGSQRWGNYVRFSLAWPIWLPKLQLTDEISAVNFIESRRAYHFVVLAAPINSRNSSEIAGWCGDSDCLERLVSSIASPRAAGISDFTLST